MSKTLKISIVIFISLLVLVVMNYLNYKFNGFKSTMTAFNLGLGIFTGILTATIFLKYESK